MEKTIQKIQIFYEIAMAVGKSLDLRQMLKQAVLAYLRKLNCVCGLVYKVNLTNKCTYANNIIFSIPFINPVNKAIAEVVDKIPSELTQADLEDYREQLTISGTTSQNQFYHIMQLGSFGFLVLVRNKKPLDNDIILTLKEINLKLGQACEACERNKELIESEGRYKSMFYNNKSIMLILDSEDGNIMGVNNSALDFYGYSRSQMLSMNIDELSLLPRKQIEEMMQDAIADRETIFSSQHRLSNGEVRDISAYCSKINFKGKQLLYAIIHDITKQLQAEKDLVEAKEKAEESDKLKSAFLANMSHEIRTPMNSIIGFSELFLNDKISEEKRKFYARTVIGSGRHLLEIVNDILDISKIESGSFKLKQESVHINYLLNELYAQFKIQEQEKQVVLYLQNGLNDDEGIIDTDRFRLTQVLTNLLNNAFKFTREGHIKFGYIFESDKFQFFVEDTGIGIPEKIHEKIFEPFRQAEVETVRTYGGTGLGLSISKKIVELLGGTIWLKSQEGIGTTFKFTLPKK